MPVLFKQVTKGDFYMPPHVTDEAKDLINRMLQTNPIKRIKISEILAHPW
jgi:serine/threonine protein kinase